MKFIDLDQGTQEWLAWRQTGITASDIAVVLGFSPYKTRWQLWAEKTGLRPPDNLSGNPAVRRGAKYENLLRRKISSDKNLSLMPACIQHDDYPQFKASLDGLDYMLRPWELKIPLKVNYNDVRDNGPDSDQYRRYLPQINHQMLCLGTDEGLLVFGDVDDLSDPPSVTDYVILPVKADKALQQRIMVEGLKFIDQVLNRVEPAKDPERDILFPESPEQVQIWDQVATQLIPLLDEKQRLENRLKLIEADLKSVEPSLKDLMGNFRKAHHGPLAVTKVTRKGHVNWSAFIKSKGDDPDDDALLDPFRSSSTTSTQLKLLD